MVKTRSQKRELEEDDIMIKKKRRVELNEELSEDSDEELNEDSSEESYDEFSEDIKKLMTKSIKKLFAIRNDSKKKVDMNDIELNKFNEYIEDVYTGDFFGRVSAENSKFTKEEIKKMNDEMDNIRDIYKNKGPSIVDILNKKCSLDQKQKLLEKVHCLMNSDVLSNEYNINLKYLMTNINNDIDDSLLELEEKIINNSVNSGVFDSYKKKVLKSKMSFRNKVIAYKKLEIMNTYEEVETSEYAKYKNWMDSLLSVPFGEYNNIPVDISNTKLELKNFMKGVRETLDSKLSFLENPKDQIINIVSQMIRNPKCNINAIGLHGVAGIGKTAITETIAKALNRPLRMISLGGESDSSSLTGHNFTYIGSNPGRFIEILKETKTMNPIILLDELDKISDTHHGKEIIGTLIHLTDSTSNSNYISDKYFSGIEFDLSKVLFVFTYNDYSKIDPILADRLYKIKVDNYNYKEKLEITKKHLVCTILEELNLTGISFSDDAIEYLIECSKSDEGMRNIKTKIKIILTRINVLLLTNEDDKIINLKYKKLYKNYNTNNTSNIVIPKEHIDLLLDESISKDYKNKNDIPFNMYI